MGDWFKERCTTLAKQSVRMRDAILFDATAFQHCDWSIDHFTVL